MTIDIIEAAKADRQTTENLLAIARDQLTELSEYVLRLQLDLIEQDSHIKWAMDILERAGNHPESTTPEPSNSGACGAETGDLRTTPSEPEIPTIPQAQEDEETVRVPEIDLAPMQGAAKTKKQIIFDTHQEHPDWWAEKIADETGIALGTVRSYASGFKLNLPPKPSGGQSKATKAILATGKRQEAKKPVARPVEAKEPEPRPTLPNEPIRPVRTAPKAMPSSTKFRLRNADGQYLHSDLAAMLKTGLRFVGRREYPWEGSEKQLLNVRKMLPQTADLSEEIIQ